MSQPVVNQILKVDGEVRVVTPADQTVRAQGRLNFTNPAETTIGELKIFGSSQSSYRMILDTSGLNNGLSIRTSQYSGTATEGGQGFPYIANFSKNYVEFNAPFIIRPLFSLSNDTSLTMLSVNKGRDTDSLKTKVSTVSEVTMDSLGLGQACATTIGQTATMLRSIWAYRGGYTPTSLNYGFLGMTTNTSQEPRENIKLYHDGKVVIPGRLEVGTISATNYEMVPITLDKTNNLVGINKTVPTKALDVVGDILASGRVDATTIRATNYENLPLGDVLPLTLDKTNGHVGINNTVPDKALDVTGDGSFTGDLSSLSLITQSAAVMGTVTANTVVANTYEGLDPIHLVNDSVGIGTVNPQAKLHVVGDIKGGTLTVDTVNAQNYVGLPLAPITLDPTNHRVGINTATPDETLQVAGDCHVDNQLRCAQIFCGDGTFTSMGVLTLDASDLNVTGNTHVYGPVQVDNTLTATTVNAGTYLNLPPPNVAPITLDTVNTRVGINKTNPAQALDVTGSIQASANLLGKKLFMQDGVFPAGPTMASFKAGTGPPEGVVNGAPGSLYSSDAGKVYLKVSGEGLTGWSEFGGGGGTPQSVFQTTPVTLTTANTVYNILSLTLNPGNYNLSAVIQISSNQTTVAGPTKVAGGITTAATDMTFGRPDINTPRCIKCLHSTIHIYNGQSGTPFRDNYSTAVVLTAQTTVYLNVQISFGSVPASTPYFASNSYLIATPF